MRYAFRSVRPALAAEMAECASGRELREIGFEADVEVAAEVDVSDSVPVLGAAGSFAVA